MRMLVLVILICTGVVSAQAAENTGANASLTLMPSAPSGVALTGEKAEMRVAIANLAANPRTLRLVMRMTNDVGVDNSTEKELSLAPSAKGELSFAVPSEPGYTAFHAALREGENVLLERDSALVVVEPPRPAPTGDRAVSAFFGLQRCDFDPEAARRLGVRQCRWFVHMSRLKPGMNEEQWQAADREIDAMRAKGLGVLLTLEVREGEMPSEWKSIADAGTPEGLGQWHAFVRAVAERWALKAIGFELVNEPDNAFWHHPKKLSLEQASSLYADLLHAGAEEIRRVAPGVPILGLDVSGRDYIPPKQGPSEHFPGGLTFTRAVLAKAADAIDVYSGHPYSSERTFRRGVMAQTPDEMNLRALNMEARDILAKTGRPLRQWTSELGWCVTGDCALWSEETRRLAATTSQALVQLRSVPGFEKAFWFLLHWHNWQEPSNYGLLWCPDNFKRTTPPGARCGLPLYPTPAAAAYATTAYHLEFAHPVHEVRMDSRVSAWRFDHDTDATSVIVAYAPVHAEYTLTAQVPDGVAVYSMFGRRIGDAPSLAVPFSSYPLFLTVPTASADALEAALRSATLRPRQPIAIRKAFFADDRTVGLVLENALPREATVTVAPGRQGAAPATRRIAAGRSIEFLPLPQQVSPGEATALRLSGEGVVANVSLRFDALPLPYRAIVADKDLLSQFPPLTMSLASRENLIPVDAGWRGPSDLSASAAFAWNSDGLCFFAAVTDDIHVAPYDGAKDFSGSDSIQIGIDPAGAAFGGYDRSCREIGLVLGNNGPRAFVLKPGTGTQGLPCRFAADRKGTVTRYALFVRWSDLGITPPHAGRVLAMSFIVNENDGQGRESCLGLTPGMGEPKAPEKFRSFVLSRTP